MKKKKTISRILAVLFAAVMTACFVPLTGALVFADDAGAKVPISGLYVGDSSEVTKAGEISNTGGTGRATVSTDETTGSVILTLNSFHYNGTGFKESAIDYNGEAPLIIELVGENEITTSSETGINWHGNNSSGKKLTIKGGGASLLVDADTNGIINKLGKVVIEGCTVKANVTRTGIHASGVTVSNAKVVATAKTKEDDKVYGIYSSDSITIDGSQVEAYGSSGAGESGNVWGYGLSAGDYTVIKNGSTVTAVGNLKAIYGTVKNDVGGKGWTDTSGTNPTALGAAITASEEGQIFEDYKKLFFAPVHTHDDITFEPWTSTDSLPNSADNYYLTDNVTLTSTWDVPTGTTSLCLNGHGIQYKGNDEKPVITIGNFDTSSTLNLYDCDTTTGHFITFENWRGTEIDNAQAPKDVDSNGNGVVKITGGFITGGSNTGVHVNGVSKETIFNMNGGTIIGNNKMGGVYLFGNKAEFNMTYGSISNNMAEKDGGGVNVTQKTTFNMTGGSITNNIANGKNNTNGGGVWVSGNNATFKVSGAPKITGNKTGDKERNVYLKSPAKINVTDKLTGEGDSKPKIGVTMSGNPGVFTNGWSAKMNEYNPADYFFSDDADYIIRETSEHEAQLVPVNGSLKLTKLVTVNGEATEGTLADGTYEFTIKGPGSDGKVSKKVTITVTNGKAASATVDGNDADLDSDGYVEVADLKAGEYVITETAPTNGTSLVGNNNQKVTVEAGKSGANVGKGAKAVFTNNINVTEIEVDKAWVNADGSAYWPEGVTVEIQLTADGEAVAGKTDTLSAEKPSCKFENLPKYRADGTTEIVYSVKEVEVPGYESIVSDLNDGKITITNTWETMDVEVEKKWANADGTDTWPEGVTVEIQLTADGEAVAGKTDTLSAAKPSCKFESLPKYQADGTTEIVYGVEEGNVPNGYMSKTGKITDGKITVTNTCKAKVIVTVTKDDEAVSGMAAYLTLKDGEGTEYKNLFVYDNGSYVYDPSRKGAQQLSNGDYDLSFEAPGYLDASLGITYVEDVADIKTTFDYYTVSIEKDPAQSQLMDVKIAGEGKAPEPSGKVAARNKDKLDIKTTVKDGYHFDGYSVLGTALVWEPDKAEQTIGVQGTAEIMAHVEANVYTVHFDPNRAGCTGTMEDQDMVYDQPQQLYANQFTCAGTTFAGWNTKADGSGTPYKDGERVSNLTAEDGGKVTLYAQWTVKPAINKKQAKISLDAGLMGTSSKGKVTAAWGIAKDADYYEVYAAYCGEDLVYKKIKTVNGKSSKLDIKKLGGKKLNPKRSVKYYVVAYKTVDGKKVKLARSLTVHVVGSGNTGKSNIKSIQVTKKNYTLKKGKTAKIKAKLVLYQKGRKTLDHERKFRYATSNDKVATVSKNGKIKAVGKGKCEIYVYSQNGCAKKIRVTVN